MSISPYQIIVNQRRNGLFSSWKKIVFDLDCTLTNIHFCSNKVDSRTIETTDLDRLIDVTYFRNFVNFLISKRVEVAIATYGKKMLALELMNRVFPNNNPFNRDNIITPIDISMKYSVNWKECYNPPKDYNKNAMLQLLRGNFEPFEILLIDDTLDNIVNAKKLGYDGVNVNSCQGFKETLRTLIREIIKRNPELSVNQENDTNQILETFA